MNFGEQFKKMRMEKNLTQEQTAEMLFVSRQAVSNWENNHNLPDIEMLVTISEVFQLSLDSLLIDEGDSTLARKIIRDGSEVRRAKLNLIAFIIGTLLIFFGCMCTIIKSLSVEYVDEAGLLHENFFLVPISFVFIMCGLIVFAVTGLKNLVYKSRQRKNQTEKEQTTKPPTSKPNIK